MRFLQNFLETSDSGISPSLLFPGIPELQLLSLTMSIKICGVYTGCVHSYGHVDFWALGPRENHGNQR